MTMTPGEERDRRIRLACLLVIVAGLALAWWGPGLFSREEPVPWGEGPLNVWNVLLAVFLVLAFAGGIYGEISGWRSTWCEYWEELARLSPDSPPDASSSTGPSACWLRSPA